MMMMTLRVDKYDYSINLLLFSTFPDTTVTTTRTRNQDRTNTHIQDDVDGHNGRTVVCGNIISWIYTWTLIGTIVGYATTTSSLSTLSRFVIIFSVHSMLCPFWITMSI